MKELTDNENCINKANSADNNDEMQQEESMNFIDRYYMIDTQLARTINDCCGGFSYLIGGMTERGYSHDIVEVFERVRHCRNMLVYDVKSSYIDFAQNGIEADMDFVKSWVNDNIGLVKELVAIGKNASERRK